MQQASEALYFKRLNLFHYCSHHCSPFAAVQQDGHMKDFVQPDLCNLMLLLFSPLGRRANRLVASLCMHCAIKDLICFGNVPQMKDVKRARRRWSWSLRMYSGQGRSYRTSR